MRAELEMTDADKLSAAHNQLQLVLSFFGRVDAKLSVVLGIDLTMLGVIFTKAGHAASLGLVEILSTIVFCGCIIFSLIELYRGSFPSLDGGRSSLIYFQEIAKLPESDFRNRFTSLTTKDLTSDLLNQAWRNSRIIATKFQRLKSAYSWMAWATVPWTLTLATISYQGA
jgi:hypothetical protein